MHFPKEMKDKEQCQAGSKVEVSRPNTPTLTVTGTDMPAFVPSAVLSTFCSWSHFRPQAPYEVDAFIIPISQRKQKSCKLTKVIWLTRSRAQIHTLLFYPNSGILVRVRKAICNSWTHILVGWTQKFISYPLIIHSQCSLFHMVTIGLSLLTTCSFVLLLVLMQVVERQRAGSVWGRTLSASPAVKWKWLSRVRLFATPWTYIVHGILQAWILE